MYISLLNVFIYFMLINSFFPGKLDISGVTMPEGDDHKRHTMTAFSMIAFPVFKPRAVCSPLFGMTKCKESISLPWTPHDIAGNQFYTITFVLS